MPLGVAGQFSSSVLDLKKLGRRTLKCPLGKLKIAAPFLLNRLLEGRNYACLESVRVMAYFLFLHFVTIVRFFQKFFLAICSYLFCLYLGAGVVSILFGAGRQVHVCSRPFRDTCILYSTDSKKMGRHRVSQERIVNANASLEIYDFS